MLASSEDLSIVIPMRSPVTLRSVRPLSWCRFKVDSTSGWVTGAVLWTEGEKSCLIWIQVEIWCPRFHFYVFTLGTLTLSVWLSWSRSIYLRGYTPVGLDEMACKKMIQYKLKHCTCTRLFVFPVFGSVIISAWSVDRLKGKVFIFGTVFYYSTKHEVCLVSHFQSLYQMWWCRMWVTLTHYPCENEYGSEYITHPLISVSPFLSLLPSHVGLEAVTNVITLCRPTFHYSLVFHHLLGVCCGHKWVMWSPLKCWPANPGCIAHELHYSNNRLEELAI